MYSQCSLMSSFISLFMQTKLGWCCYSAVYKTHIYQTLYFHVFLPKRNWYGSVPLGDRLVLTMTNLKRDNIEINKIQERIKAFTLNHQVCYNLIKVESFVCAD